MTDARRLEVSNQEMEGLQNASITYVNTLERKVAALQQENKELREINEANSVREQIAVAKLQREKEAAVEVAAEREEVLKIELTELKSLLDRKQSGLDQYKEDSGTEKKQFKIAKAKALQDTIGSALITTKRLAQRLGVLEQQRQDAEVSSAHYEKEKIILKRGMAKSLQELSAETSSPLPKISPRAVPSPSETVPLISRKMAANPYSSRLLHGGNCDYRDWSKVTARRGSDNRDWSKVTVRRGSSRLPDASSTLRRECVRGNSSRKKSSNDLPQPRWK